LALIKTRKEIKLLKKAAKIALTIFEVISKNIKVGVRECDVAREIELQIKKRGLKKSFRTIVAGGPNSASPHAKPTKRLFKSGDSVVVDFGVIYKGYHSDMTRTFLLGRVKPKIRLLYKTVVSAQNRAIKKVKAGLTISEVVKDANDFIRNRGLGKYILHSLGHGIGLRIHEAPRLSEKNKKKFRINMVCTIEPGLYVDGLGGVRMEDMVLVGYDKSRVLTR